VRSAHIIATSVTLKTKESAMHNPTETSLTPEHRDFYERFKSFWAAPSGARVTELIAPDATIHFTGAGTFSGTEYIDIMQGMIDSMAELKVTPLDCAGDGERLYIFWETSALVDGVHCKYLGVDRFRLTNGMAIEEHVIFDSAALKLSS
jgi:SnoaL-like domain